MGRPRSVSDDEILDGALTVLSRVGPQGLTLAAVAGEVGLHAPTLIQRFGSKRDLLIALSARGIEHLPALFAPACRRRGSAVAAIVSALRELVAGIGSPAVMGHHLAFLAMDLTDPDLSRLAAAHAGALTAEIRAGLDRAVGAGELSANPAALARAVYTAYNGSLIAWALNGRGDLGSWMAADVRAVLAPYTRRRGTRA